MLNILSQVICMRLKDVNELKSLYVGKTYNKLTIVDVYRLDKKWMVKCTCECGNSCDKQLDKVVSGHTKTCSGRIHKLEQNANNSQLYKDNPELGKQAGDYANREPARHKLVMNAMRDGNCISVKNPGSYTNIFVRTGYHLEGMKVVQDS